MNMHRHSQVAVKVMEVQLDTNLSMTQFTERNVNIDFFFLKDHWMALIEFGGSFTKLRSSYQNDRSNISSLNQSSSAEIYEDAAHT